MGDRYAPISRPERHRKTATQGYARKEKRRIVIEWDEETFHQIERLAVDSDVSFAEMVRQLVEWGLEAV